jgi:hypothetical protein
MSTRSTSIFKDPNVAKHLSLLHDNFFFIVSADKVHNNIVSVCKSHYIDCLIKELGIDNLLGNSTYTVTTLTRKSWTIIGLFYVPLEFQPKMKNWIHHHSTGFLNYTSVLSNSYIVSSAKCSTKPISKLLTCILLAVKTGLQSYCDTSYSSGGVNQIWTLKNSKDLLEYLQSKSLSSWNIIKTFDFSTLYTTIPHSKLKDK